MQGETSRDLMAFGEKSKELAKREAQDCSTIIPISLWGTLSSAILSINHSYGFLTFGYTQRRIVPQASTLKTQPDYRRMEISQMHGRKACELKTLQDPVHGSRATAHKHF